VVPYSGEIARLNVGDLVGASVTIPVGDIVGA